MSRRKWFVRGLVFAVIGVCAAAIILYQRWTNPAAVKQQVLAKLRELFPGGQATVDSARLRILGGIMVNELRMARLDDLERTDLIHVPSAVLYHDKEKLLDGDLALRKVELYRPRLTVQRGSDGKWNLAGLTGPLRPHLALPTLVVHQGTLVFEDRSEEGPPKTFELSNAQLTLINDPISVVAIEGSAESAGIGKVRVTGQWQRGTQDLALSFRGSQLKLSPVFVEKIAAHCPAGTLQGLKLDGKLDLQADLTYNPAASQPLSYDVRLELRDGTVRHPKMPMPLEAVQATIDCSHGEVRLKSLQAKSGKAVLSAHGSAELPCIDQFFEGHVEIKHLELNSELFANLTEKLKKLNTTFQPEGPVTLRLDCARRAGAWEAVRGGGPSKVAVLPESLAIEFVKFPYRLERTTGTLDMNLETQLIEIDITGYSGARPVFIKGTWKGEGPQADAHFEIFAQDIPLDDKLYNALKPNPTMEKLARSFNAAGKGDFKAHVRHEPGDAQFHCEYHVRIHDATARWEKFPYLLENVSGYLDIYPKRWEFRDFHGSHQGGDFTMQGHSVPRTDGSLGLVVDLTGKNVLLDQQMHRALEELPQLSRSWETFQPRGRMNFTAKIQQHAPGSQDMEVNLEVNGGSVTPLFFPYLLEDIQGAFHFRNHRLEGRALSARHGAARLTIDRTSVDLHRGGGHFTEISTLHMRDLLIDDAMLKAMPRGLREGAASLRLRDPCELKTRIVIAQSSDPGSQPDLFWDGRLWFKKARISTGIDWSDVDGVVACVGRWNGRQLLGVNGNVMLEKASLFRQPFHDVHAKFQVKEKAPDVMLLAFKAPIFGGDIAGEGRLEFNSQFRYELNLTASQIELTQFGKHNLGGDTQLQGVAVGRLHLMGQGNDPNTLDGNGSLDVPAGKLYNLPLLLDLLKFLGLRWPDRTAFEELHALFSIRGRRVHMRRLELWGNAISLNGEGEFNLDGTDVALDFYPSWARVEQLLPPAVRTLPRRSARTC